MKLLLFHNSSSFLENRPPCLNLVHFLLCLSFLLQDFDNIKTFVEEELQTSMVSFTPTMKPWRPERLYPHLTCSPLSLAPPLPAATPQMVGMVIGAGIAIVLIAILIFFILRRIQLRSQ